MTTMHSTRSSLPRRALLTGALAAVGLAVTPVSAPALSPVPAALVDLSVVDRETGEEARVWRHEGRLFVAGRPGARYSIRVHNNSAGRVLVVMSVDGVNVLTGATAGYNQRGYVLSPYRTADIAGWRKSETEIAAFTFAPLSSSYAARTGRPGEVGVIGIAAFTERAAPPPPPPAVAVMPESRAESARDAGAGRAYGVPPPPPPPPPPAAAMRAQPAPQDALQAAPQAAPQPSERLGTAHGEREWSVSRTTTFERASSRPQYVSQLEYDSYDNLVARGVIPRPQPVPRGPRPFPGNGYVPDPPRGR